MLDVKLVREQPDAVEAALSRRADYRSQLDTVRTADAQRRDLLQQVEAQKAERNSASEEVAASKKAGRDATELLENLKTLSQSIKMLDQQVRDVDAQLRDALLRLPNLPLDHVPEGDQSANVIERTWGEVPSPAFEPRQHWDLAEALGILDLPRGAKISGSGFPLFIGQGAKLVRALITFMIDLHTEQHGYREVAPPFLVNADSALGTGQLPDLEHDMYVTVNGLYLIPTAEVPVTNMHRDEILAADQLPIAYVAYTPCFRRESGAGGKDTRGLLRVHQFDKVELVRMCEPSASPKELENLLKHAEAVLQHLDLPYRVVTLATGDLGFASANTIDLEVWSAGAGTWLEVSSASTFTDFQARRANIRYRPTKGAKPEFVHTLNASGLAIPRTLVALLENNQEEDGSVRIPEVLAPYFGSDRLTPDGPA